MFHQENTTPKGNWIYVFAADDHGSHKHGYAKIAKVNFGARYGQSRGAAGSSFALEVFDRRGDMLSADLLGEQLDAFVQMATDTPKTNYFFTSFAAGDRLDDICAALARCPQNVSLPEIWQDQIIQARIDQAGREKAARRTARQGASS